MKGPKRICVVILAYEFSLYYCTGHNLFFLDEEITPKLCNDSLMGKRILNGVVASKQGNELAKSSYNAFIQEIKLLGLT